MKWFFIVVSLLLVCAANGRERRQPILSIQEQIGSKKAFFEGVYVPKDLDDAFRELDRMLPDSVKTREALARVVSDHFGIGRWIRNSWGLSWGGSRLAKYFNALGVKHPDDMSSIILNSYYRHVSGEDIALQEQIDELNDFYANQ